MNVVEPVLRPQQYARANYLKREVQHARNAFAQNPEKYGPIFAAYWAVIGELFNTGPQSEAEWTAALQAALGGQFIVVKGGDEIGDGDRQVQVFVENNAVSHMDIISGCEI